MRKEKERMGTGIVALVDFLLYMSRCVGLLVEMYLV